MTTAVAGGVLGLVSGTTLFLFIATVIVIIYFIYNQFKDDDSWEKYGVKEGKMGFRDFRSLCTELIAEHGDTVGVKRAASRLLITRDLDLLKQIMVKDFNSFIDRAGPIQSKSPIAKGLFFLPSKDWKRVRQILSPTFSTGKLKHMAISVDETARKLVNFLEDCARNDRLVPLKDSAGQYTSEIIAKTAFGLQTDCVGGEADEFMTYSKRMFKMRGKFMSKVMLVCFRYPALHSFLVHKLGLNIFDGIDEKADVYFNSVLRASVAERRALEESGAKRPQDFLQSLVEAKMAGDKAEANGETHSDVSNGQSAPDNKISKTMTEHELMGQAMLVIFAGFETTSTTLQFCLYELARHPDIQERVYREIEEVVTSDTPTHDELGQLKYMEQVINETLRLYPPASVVTRKAMETKTYGSITIPKDTGIIIPIFSVLKDPKNFPDPEKFDPDRFTEENKANRNQLAFLAFGFGPRLCIGMRLAYLELKTGLVHVLRKVIVEVNEKTTPKQGEEPKLKLNTGLIQLEEPIQLAVKLRNP